MISTIGVAWVVILFLALFFSLVFLPTELIALLAIPVVVCLVIAKIATWSFRQSGAPSVTQQLTVEYPSLFVSRSSGAAREISLLGVAEAYVAESGRGYSGLGLKLETGEKLVHHLPVAREALQTTIEEINRACHASG